MWWKMQKTLSIIDEWLTLTVHRETFTSDEVADLLLDVRGSLCPDPVPV